VRQRGPGRPAFEERISRTGVFAIRLSDEDHVAITAANAGWKADHPVGTGDLDESGWLAS
jgi:tRNA A37 threonylcarbamoyladenosine dehydratase